MEFTFDVAELVAGLALTAAVAAGVSVVAPSSFALAGGLALGLPFLAAGAELTEPSPRDRLETASTALVVGVLAALAAPVLPQPARIPAVVGATYLAGSLVAVTR
ncbi:hypothetical protein [Salarchaeum japonicum]|uniref:Integral membrane protein n=1 Tax=Salarchaeum japonicum TaxID=555573 RepID=A0AAV3SZ61_9EURY|nr:hypothetical protein [Salarchaeum japonicum]